MPLSTQWRGLGALQSQHTGTVPMAWPCSPPQPFPLKAPLADGPDRQPFSLHPHSIPPCTVPLTPPALSSSGLSSSQNGSACPCSILSQVFLLCGVPPTSALPQPLHPTLFLFPRGWGGSCSLSVQLSLASLFSPFLLYSNSPGSLQVNPWAGRLQVKGPSVLLAK